MFSHIWISKDSPMLVGWLRGIRDFFFLLILFFLSLDLLSKLAPHSNLREEGEQEECKDREVEEVIFILDVQARSCIYNFCLHHMGRTYSRCHSCKGDWKCVQPKNTIPLERGNVHEDWRGETAAASTIEAWKPN